MFRSTGEINLVMGSVDRSKSNRTFFYTTYEGSAIGYAVPPQRSKHQGLRNVCKQPEVDRGHHGDTFRPSLTLQQQRRDVGARDLAQTNSARQRTGYRHRHGSTRRRRMQGLISSRFVSITNCGPKDRLYGHFITFTDAHYSGLAVGFPEVQPD
jgi:hypothetical protein